MCYILYYIPLVLSLIPFVKTDITKMRFLKKKKKNCKIFKDFGTF